VVDAWSFAKELFMNTCIRSAIAVGFCLAIGCSSSTAPKLVPADGIVTYMGKPVAGATVLFSPEKGPLASGVTDMEGKYDLKTGTNRGVTAGLCKVAIRVDPEGELKGASGVTQQPKTAAEAEEYMKKAAELRKSIATGKTEIKQKSMIPEKYGRIETSGLSFPIKESGENHNNIDL
jgi:hypothetical protein